MPTECYVMHPLAPNGAVNSPHKKSFHYNAMLPFFCTKIVDEKLSLLKLQWYKSEKHIENL